MKAIAERITSIRQQICPRTSYAISGASLSTLYSLTSLMKNLLIITTCSFSVYICTDIYPLQQWCLHYSCQKYCYFASVVSILFVIMCHGNYMLGTNVNYMRNVLSTLIWGIFFSSDGTNLRNLLYF